MNEFKKYFRAGFCEARPYQLGESLAGIGVSKEYEDEVATTGGGMVLRDPENHADQWYVGKAFFAKNYAQEEGDGAPESDLEVTEFVIFDDDEYVYRTEEPTSYQAALALLAKLRSESPDVTFTLHANIDA